MSNRQGNICDFISAHKLPMMCLCSKTEKQQLFVFFLAAHSSVAASNTAISMFTIWLLCCDKCLQFDLSTKKDFLTLSFKI